MSKKEWVYDVSRELYERLDLGVCWHFAVEHHVAQQFERHLYRALGPAELLALCSVHLHREFGIHFDSFQKEAFPALHLCPVAEVKVFDKCGGMPAAGVIDA